ncbi:MAG: transposase [Candidatus Neptunochlamydia sp.]|nr:transposase [Candidatus Neptunochlamydia sp.]
MDHLAYKVTGGNRHEITQAKNLMGKYECEFLIADGGYDSNEFREILREENVEPAIPGRVSRKERMEIDKHLYKEGNFIERFFNRTKGFRRIVTRYDKTENMVASLGTRPTYLTY